MTRCRNRWKRSKGIPHADASDKEIKELIDRLKVFQRGTSLRICSTNAITLSVTGRNGTRSPHSTKLPKFFSIKVYVERELKAKRKRQNLFQRGIP